LFFKESLVGYWGCMGPLSVGPPLTLLYVGGESLVGYWGCMGPLSVDPPLPLLYVGEERLCEPLGVHGPAFCRSSSHSSILR